MPLVTPVSLMDVCTLPLRDRSGQVRMAPERQAGRRHGPLVGTCSDGIRLPNQGMTTVGANQG